MYHVPYLPTPTCRYSTPCLGPVNPLRIHHHEIGKYHRQRPIKGNPEKTVNFHLSNQMHPKPKPQSLSTTLISDIDTGFHFAQSLIQMITFTNTLTAANIQILSIHSHAKLNNLKTWLIVTQQTLVHNK